MDVKYHINPATGNALICRAKIRCKYGTDSAHYSTPEEARAAFEKQASNSVLDVLRGTRLSKGAKLLIQLDRANQAIAAFEQESQASGQDPYARVDVNLVLARNTLSSKLERELEWDDNDGPDFDDSVTVQFNTRTYERGEIRVGYDKDSFTPKPEAAAIFKQMDAASAEWIKRLSTAEIKAIVTYNLASDAYSLAVEGGTPEDFDPRVVKYLHSAMEKAPRSEHTFTVYAGISEHRCLAIREMGESGTIELNRVQSATVNPGQINAFMRQSDPYRDGFKGTQDETALEIRTSRVASLSAFNVHKDEMELLIPPGSYRVVEKQHDLIYTWNDGPGPNRKRDAETTYIIEEV